MLRVSVQPRVFELRHDPRDQPVPERGDSLHSGFHLQDSDAGRFSKTDNRGYVCRSRSQASLVTASIDLLHQARLVDTRKDGRWVYYRLAERPAGSHAQAALDMTLECLQKDNQVREDARRVRSIRKMAREKLCKLRQD